MVWKQSQWNKTKAKFLMFESYFQYFVFCTSQAMEWKIRDKIAKDGIANSAKTTIACCWQKYNHHITTRLPFQQVFTMGDDGNNTLV
jgi:hypothetical protein